MTIQFPDLSHHKQVSLDGALALITKATQGTSYVDPTYATYKADADRRGIPFAGYHWVDFADIGSQALHSYKVMGSVPCMWDAEAAGATVPRLAELTRRYRELGGNPRLVYLPRWFWRDHLGSPSLRPLVDEGLALVSSAYPSSGYSDTGIGWQPYGGMSPAIWQYTDAHPFNGAAVDFNAFKGTVDQLRALFNGDDTPTTKEPTMLLAQLKGTQAVTLSTGLEYRGIIAWSTALKLRAAGVPFIVADNEAEMADLCGQPYTASGGGGGLTEDRVHAIVREELDKTKLSG